MEVDGTSSRPNTNKRSFVRPAVCTYYMEGRCNRNPCNFLHPDDPSAVASHTGAFNGKRPNFTPDDSSFQGGTNRRNVWGRLRGSKAGKVSALGEARHGKPRDKLCHFFLRGNCNKGDQCNFVHSYTNSDEISFMTQLSGHGKAVRAIALPAGSNKLYTGGQDGTIRVWDCDTGQCAHVLPMGGDVGCLLAEAGWLFVGLPNELQALNLQTGAEQRLTGPVGQVHALAIYNDTIIAGAQDGNILAWKFNSVVNMFQPVAALPGHTGAVVTLEASEGKLYSGSMDFTIRVWDLSTAVCIQTLQGHSNVVMGLLSWNQYLLSGSLDGTVKVWAASQSGSYDLQYTYPKDTGSNEDMDGVLAFCGFVDSQNKNILICALNDNTVHLLELPSFTDRGVLYSKDEVRALQVGPGGLVFSGDGSGSVKVWKWAPS
ncbi:hypothetical protein GOP47_0000941 [Adiantum capillus-veneris]|uniref:C3H1-type domain-containing protein n=1 Tax=Adiantum capillus-veneris TaxID=13818 RepID=A0A9D4ZTE3_ADICA|nr:hypothetical protein GOP47_0000941 [Adiantum capillus-veneris]